MPISGFNVTDASFHECPIPRIKLPHFPHHPSRCRDIPPLAALHRLAHLVGILPSGRNRRRRLADLCADRQRLLSRPSLGLVQFIPSALLVFVAGHAAIDRHDRRRIVQLCELTQGLAAFYLAMRLFTGTLTAPEIFVVLAVFGLCSASESLASSALLPAVAPEGMLQRATALATGAWQVASIGGPAVGGLAYALSPSAPSGADGGAVADRVRSQRPDPCRACRPSEHEKRKSTGCLRGFTFVRNNPAILGTISLDLFAVLLGGATALLPIYAGRHLAGWSLGARRHAARRPRVGALCMTAIIARATPIARRAGLRMFQAVIASRMKQLPLSCSRCRVNIWLSR